MQRRRGKSILLRTRTLKMIREDGPQSLCEMLTAYPPPAPKPCEADGCEYISTARWCPKHKQEALDELVASARRRFNNVK